MTTTGFVFLILKWIEFIMLFLSGKALESTKTRNRYWQIAIIPIVVFALVEGLRWGRLIDWNNAVVEYSELNTFVNERNTSNPLYTVVVFSLKCLGLPYWFFVVLQCGFLMFSSLFLLQDYRRYLRWILPCLIMAFINNENFIRYYFAVSFLFIAIYYYLHGSIRNYVIFSVTTALIHFSQVPLLLLVPFINRLDKRKFSRAYAIVIYLVCLFLVDISQMSILVKISDYIVSLMGTESEYRLFSALNSMNDIISGTAYGTEERLFIRKLSNIIANALLYVPLLWMAPSYLKNIKYGNMIYNLTVLNLILTAVFGQAELLHRIPMSFNIFVVISFAAVVANSISKNKNVVLVYMMLFIYFYAFLNAPFVREDYMMYFLWDSNGAATNYTPYLH